MSRTLNDGAKKARAILRQHYEREATAEAVEALLSDLRAYCRQQGLAFDHLARRSLPPMPDDTRLSPATGVAKRELAA